MVGPCELLLKLTPMRSAPRTARPTIAIRQGQVRVVDPNAAVPVAHACVREIALERVRTAQAFANADRTAQAVVNPANRTTFGGTGVVVAHFRIRRQGTITWTGHARAAASTTATQRHKRVNGTGVGEGKSPTERHDQGLFEPGFLNRRRAARRPSSG